MTKYFILFLSFFITLSAKEFTVASYNVENLFDLEYQGTEYKEYKPYTKYWHKKAFNNKLKNISKTINELNSDIIALQEIESKVALDKLNQLTPLYKYSSFIKNKNSSIGVAILSKYPILKISKIKVDRYDKYSRDILKATISIENKSIVLFVNHWRSKRAKESKRIVYATALKNHIDTLDKNSDYIILGDLNSDYNEYQTFKYNRKLNNTYGITGINQILNTTLEENYISKETILNYKKVVHYNLWLDLKKKDRFSSIFKGNHNTPDNIILSKGLFDNKNISYVDNSFNVFKPSFLYSKNKIKRWNRNKSTGYSDHLPIYATFTTDKTIKSKVKKIKQSYISKIDYLYTIEQLTKPIFIKNVIVIYKSNKTVILKAKNQRAIMYYNPSYTLNLGDIYNITVDKIDRYNGLKEIKELTHISKIGFDRNYKNNYLKAKDINIENTKYQNDIVTNLVGTYKKGYLYYKFNGKVEKIKLYFKDKNLKPKSDTKLNISSGHISIYKSKIQIVIYSKEDFDTLL